MVVAWLVSVCGLLCFGCVFRGALIWFVCLVPWFLCGMRGLLCVWFWYLLVLILVLCGAVFGFLGVLMFAVV